MPLVLQGTTWEKMLTKQCHSRTVENCNNDYKLLSPGSPIFDNFSSMGFPVKTMVLVRIYHEHFRYSDNSSKMVGLTSRVEGLGKKSNELKRSDTFEGATFCSPAISFFGDMEI